MNERNIHGSEASKLSTGRIYLNRSTFIGSLDFICIKVCCTFVETSLFSVALTDSSSLFCNPFKPHFNDFCNVGHQQSPSVNF